VPKLAVVSRRFLGVWATTAALVAAGYTPRLFDFRPLETEYEFVQGDVRNAEAI